MASNKQDPHELAGYKIGDRVEVQTVPAWYDSRLTKGDIGVVEKFDHDGEHVFAKVAVGNTGITDSVPFKLYEISPVYRLDYGVMWRLQTYLFGCFCFGPCTHKYDRLNSWFMNTTWLFTTVLRFWKWARLPLAREPGT